MLGIVPPRPPTAPPFEPDQTTTFDWNERLSLELVRAHTKTDDIPGVTDEQLALYRAASLEAAEFYTGMLLSGQRTVTEPIEGPSPSKRASAFGNMFNYSSSKFFYRVKLQYPVADGIVYLYGSPHADDNRPFHVKQGTRTIKVPIRTGFLDLSNCCDPCSSHHYNAGMFACYRAGFCSPADVPSGVVLGCLQFMAWTVEHPGDELLTQRNRRDNSTKIGGVSGSNNIAMVSGALETWKLYDPELM